MNFTRAAIGARGARKEQGGAVLVLFAILVFALLGIAALCVDLGFASLAQSQMQTAADTASLEGLRLRDYHEYRSFGARYQRGRVSELVRQVFDDDMHPTQGASATQEEPAVGVPPPPGAMAPDDEDQLKLGAGPIYRLSGGIGASNASALLSAPGGGSSTPEEAWVDDPRLAENKANRPHGDMVVGAFNPSAAHAESDDYTRPDFATAAGTSPSDPSPMLDSIGFLVRMRRTSGSSALDAVPDVSSRGETLPLLFGMGAMIRGDSASSYDPRRDGLTVRATAIAVGRPALSIGAPPVFDSGAPVLDRIGQPIRGIGYWYYPSGITNPSARRHVAVALELGFWASFPAHQLMEDVGLVLTIQPNGSIVSDTGQSVGQLLIAPCSFASASDACPSNVGTTLGASVDVDLSQPPYLLTPAELRDVVVGSLAVNNTRRCYLPIYTAITSPSGASTRRIVGFGYGLVGANNGQPTIYKGWDGSADNPPCFVLIAPDNTSSTLSQRAPELSTSEWTQIFDQNQQFAYPNGNATYDWRNVRPGTVLTPVLAR